MRPTTSDHKIYWLALSRLKGAQALAVPELLKTFGSAKCVFEADKEPLASFSPLLCKGVLTFNAWDSLEKEIKLCEELGARVVSYDDDEYPALLRHIPDPPLALFCKGSALINSRPTVAIVGTRRPSYYGSALAESMAKGLAKAGVAVVSGLARGCDSMAHRGACLENGMTVAVLGTGIDIVYPRENKKLCEEIEASGLVLTEFSPGTPPLPRNFLRRNRIISGMSKAVVVVEAPERSGSLMTARLALEHNRDVLSVPGPVTSNKSAGTNRLIMEGAALVRSAEDVLDILGIEATEAKNSASSADELSGTKLSGDDLVIWKALGREPIQMEALIARTGMGAAKASSTLLDLELRGLVRQLPGKFFVRIS